jgi:predicted DNA-binding ribbon-helix-helix protein
MKTQRRQTGRGGHREGAGRKAFLNDARTITVTLEADDYDAVEEIAERRGQSFAAVIRTALKTYLKRQKKG